MKSTLVNMTAVLFGITLVASAGVGAVNMITAEPIAQAEQAAKVEALKVVLPPFDQTVPEALTIDDMPITVYTATKGGQVAGYAVESMTKNGFGGAISMMVGFTPDGEVAVKKDGGDVDALTAATISSRAYVDAINRAWMAYKSVATGTAPTDVSSGATSAAGDSAEEQTNGPAAQEGGQNE